MTDTTHNIKRVSCQKCIFFYVTWDRSFPYGCKAMGFKGKIMPYLMVFQASGKSCMAFEERSKNPEK
jgi:hypothetical protein